MRRLTPVADTILPESQCGFRMNRSCTDMIFAARQLQEKSREQNRPLYMAFIDLTKAYNTVNRQALWHLLLRYGVPRKLVDIIRSLHEGMNGLVRIRGDLSEPFSINNGLHQGCVIAPNLFNLFGS